MSQPKTFAQAEAILARTLPGYTPRVQQQALAEFIEEVIGAGGHGLAEAGCGTGKSLAAMIPAILNGRKTIVSTATISLMSQYANKDVPFLEEHLGVPFTWALVKGRSNYLCKAKVSQVDRAKVPSLEAMLAEIDADPNHTGDREDFQTPVSKDEFSWVASTSNECPGKRECPFGEVCFAEQAKEKGKAAQVVVTNTAMLMTDAKVRQITDGLASMLGDYDLLILDEAHELEDIATNALSEEIKESGVRRLVTEVRTFADSQDAKVTADADVLDTLAGVWDLLEEGEHTLRFFVEHQEPFIALLNALEEMAQQVRDIQVVRGEDKSEAKRALLAKRADNYRLRIHEAMTADEDHLVRWVEVEENKKGETVKSFKTAPVHVGAYLDEWLWSNTPAVLTSATMSVGGDFGFIADRLGLPGDTQTIEVGTPFDYQRQARVFVPPVNAPSPKQPGWASYAVAATRELIEAAGGGALLLFTSRAAMQRTYDALAPWLEEQGFTPLMQGLGGSNKEIAQRFKDDTNSVLFGMKSFMTGVDFQGDTLRLVVIDKLPFPVPTEPVFAARSAQVQRYGGNSFADFTIPLMSLVLEQAFGRLVRTSDDQGVVAILDSRLSSERWGKRIVKALPDCPRTTDLAEVRRFFA